MKLSILSAMAVCLALLAVMAEGRQAAGRFLGNGKKTKLKNCSIEFYTGEHWRGSRKKANFWRLLSGREKSVRTTGDCCWQFLGQHDEGYPISMKVKAGFQKQTGMKRFLSHGTARFKKVKRTARCPYYKEGNNSS